VLLFGVLKYYKYPAVPVGSRRWVLHRLCTRDVKVGVVEHN